MSSLQEIRNLNASLAEKLRVYENSQRKSNPETAAAYDVFVARLHSSNVIEGAPRIGDRLPPFALPDSQGRVVASADLLKAGPIVISFNRGSWCSYCMLELTALADACPEIQQAGATIVSVMPDRARRTKALCEAFNLPFSILTDIDNGYALANGLMVALDQEIRDIMEAAGIDLEEMQGNNAGFIPIPATYVVGQDRTIIGGGADADFRRRIPVASILGALKACRAPARA